LIFISSRPDISSKKIKKTQSVDLSLCFLTMTAANMLLFYQFSTVNFFKSNHFALFIAVLKANVADLDDSRFEKNDYCFARSFPETDRRKEEPKTFTFVRGAQHRLALSFNRRNDASSQQHRKIILKTFRFAINRKLCNDVILFFLCTLRVEQRVYITSIFFYRDRSLRVVDF